MMSISSQHKKNVDDVLKGIKDLENLESRIRSQISARKEKLYKSINIDNSIRVEETVKGRFEIMFVQNYLHCSYNAEKIAEHFGFEWKEFRWEMVRKFDCNIEQTWSNEYRIYFKDREVAEQALGYIMTYQVLNKLTEQV